mmetsp:Transcript_11657/g.13864  ORF Transcript_11657/g.13864 Transcript_11657/m.13864 type:complete len:193 (-) Transcript_11657:98-676(-)|eukprot:CAMPEP_0197845242 /NCGR_PEP_ID=MMETSP1438-20131217/2184_1 /TAXON_ID=1461541 /ORGANISM="Pterosperma sp., Strain CCMP1384" /LENGTH=192 /DNA_ID=CAMNT_0043456437 /DNA_START=71 /DNA_END=649 /DNA_ORIENTATION=+
MFFGVVFVKRSFVISSDQFVQVSPTHWTLDLASMIGQTQFHTVKDVCLFLPNEQVLPPTHALSLYVQSGSEDWGYRGCVCNQRPSEVFPLQWPEAVVQSGGAIGAKVGIVIELLEDAASKEQLVVGTKEEFAKRVALNLFNYMQSFSSQHTGILPGKDAIVVPPDCLDRWFKRFQEKFRRDPEFLTRQQDAV